MTEREMIEAALHCGAAKAECAPGEKVVLSPTFRDICQSNGCGNYGRCYMCPPDVGEIEPLIARVRSYPKGLLYQTIHEIEDSFDFEGMMEGGKLHMLCSQKLQATLAPHLPKGFLHLTAGGCRLCDTCAKQKEAPCPFPDKALPSLESYGVDVYQTASSTSLKYINGQNTVTYFGMVLFTEA